MNSGIDERGQHRLKASRPNCGDGIREGLQLPVVERASPQRRAAQPGHHEVGSGAAHSDRSGLVAKPGACAASSVRARYSRSHPSRSPTLNRLVTLSGPISIA